MGVLDFFFGRTKATPTTTTTIQSSKLPEEIAPYVKDVLAEAQRLYDEGKERGYEEYPGMTIAPRTPAEQEAIAGLRGLIGTQDTYLQEAEAALRGIPQEFTTEQAEKFMSPYQQAVIDIEKRKAEEDFQRKVMPEFERQAVQAGGMSGLGSRAGVQAGILGSEFSKQLGDIQSKGQQKAYEDAYRRFQDQMAMDRARAADLQGIGLTKFQTGIAEQGLAQQLAQADRQEMQATLDEQYAKYLEREQYPKRELAQLSSFVYGNPFLQTPDRTTTTQGMLQPNAPGVGQQLLGLGLSGLNIFGMGGGFDGGFSFNRLFQGPGGTTRSALKTGGRIVYKQEGGEIPNVYSQNQVTARPVGGGLGGFLGGVFNRYPGYNPRSNVIENIDNAAGSLSNYKEIMDENMENLRRASAGISRTYNETFGPMSGRGLGTLTPFVNRAMAQSPVLEQRVDTYGMKDGGGLGSLPVVKRQMSGKTSPPIPRTDQRTFVERMQQLLTRPSTGSRVPTNMRDRGLQPRNYVQGDVRGRTGQGGIATFVPTRGEIVSPIVEKYPEELNERGVIYNPENMPITDDEKNEPGVISPITQKSDESKKGLPSLPQNKTSGSIDANVANKIRRNAIKARSFDTILKDEQKIFDALEYYDPTKRKEMQDRREKNLDQAFKEADFELEKINIEGKEASDKFLADQEKSIKEMAGYPGGIIADAIEAGLERPSLVTMLTTVFNKTAKGLTERSKEVSAELRKLAKIEYDMGREQRDDKKQILEKKANRQLEKIGRKYDNELNLMKLPAEKRTAIRKNAIALSQIESNAIDQYIDLEKVFATASKDGSTGKSFTAAEKQIDAYGVGKFGAILSDEGILVNGMPLEADSDLAKRIQETQKIGRKVYKDALARLGTSYQAQVIAQSLAEQAIDKYKDSLSGGGPKISGGGPKIKVGATATDKKTGKQIRWDGSNWIPIN